MHTLLNHETLRAPEPKRHYVEGWPPPKRHHPPPGPGLQVRSRLATRLARLARRIDDRAAWRAFAPKP